MNTTNFLLILLGATLILCFVLMLINNTETQYEGFEDPVIDAIQDQLQSESPEQLKSTVQALQQRLIDYGYAPDVNTFVKRTELRPNDGKCLVNVAEDRDKYVTNSLILENLRLATFGKSSFIKILSINWLKAFLMALFVNSSLDILSFFSKRILLTLNKLLSDKRFPVLKKTIKMINICFKNFIKN